MTAATALFVVGVTTERGESEPHSGERIEQPRETGESHTAETGGEGEETPAHTAGGESGRHTHAEPHILGVNPESTLLVALATVGSLLLVVAVVRWPRAAALLVLVALAMLAFAALDVREVAHQFDEEHAGVALLAGVIAVLHLAAAGVAAVQAKAAADHPRYRS